MPINYNEIQLFKIAISANVNNCILLSLTTPVLKRISRLNLIDEFIYWINVKFLFGKNADKYL